MPPFVLIRLPYQPAIILVAMMATGCGSRSGASATGDDDDGSSPSPGQGRRREAGADGMLDLGADVPLRRPRTTPTPRAMPRARDDGAGADAGSPRPSPGCASQGVRATSATVSLTYGGMSRSYILHVPAGAPSGARPLVINMHGYTGSASQQEGLTAMDGVADQAGFFVAYPNGEGSPTDWNAGACCSAASEGDRDDEGFLGAGPIDADIAAPEIVRRPRARILQRLLERRDDDVSPRVRRLGAVRRHRVGLGLRRHTARHVHSSAPHASHARPRQRRSARSVRWRRWWPAAERPRHAHLPRRGR